MAALKRAVALAERDDASVPVGEELDLYVAGPFEEALEEDAVVAERRLRLAPRRGDGLVELGRVADDPHAAAAATRHRLDEQREADLLRRPGREHRNVLGACDLLRRQLVATRAQRGR